MVVVPVTEGEDNATGRLVLLRLSMLSKKGTEFFNSPRYRRDARFLDLNFDCKGGRESGVASWKNNEKIETTAFSG